MIRNVVGMPANLWLKEFGLQVRQMQFDSTEGW